MIRSQSLFRAVSSLLFLTLAPMAIALTVNETMTQDFQLPGTDGKTHSLKETLKTHDGAVIVFVGTKCPISNAYNARYNRLAKLFGEGKKKLAFLAINSNDTESIDAVKDHAKESGFTFPVLKDAIRANDNKRTADDFGAEKTPEVYLLDKKAKVIYHGRIDDSRDPSEVKREDLKEAVKDYVAGKAIKTPTTKAFGCSIKRRG